VTETRGTEDRTSMLRSFRAVRCLRPDPVPDEVVDDVLRVARWSGSASADRQPWQIVVIRDWETLDVLTAVGGYADHLAGAPLGIVLAMAGDRVQQGGYDEGGLSERMVRRAISLGYPGETFRRPRAGSGAARKALSEIVHEERSG
jgi:nitroreductase